MKIIFEILGAIPLWVYFITVYILYLGYRAKRPAKIRWFRLIFIPVILLYFSLTNLFSSPSQFFVRDLNWMVFTALGIYLGWLYLKNKTIRVDQKTKLISMPADNKLLYLFIGIFAIKYAFGYLEAASSAIGENGFFIFVKIAVFSGLTGILIGRNANLLYKYLKATHSSVAKKK